MSDFTLGNNTIISLPVYLYNNSKDLENLNLNGNDVLVIASEGLRDNLAIGADIPSYITIDGPQTHGYSAIIISMQIKISGFISFSSYYPIAMSAPLIISLDQMRNMLDREFDYQHGLKSNLTASPVNKQTYDLLKKSGLLSKTSLI